MPLTKTRQAVWPSTVPKVSAPRIIVFSLLNSPARPYRCRRFACTLTSADARLAEKRGSVTPSFRGTSTPYLPPVRLAHQNMTLHDTLQGAAALPLPETGGGQPSPDDRGLTRIESRPAARCRQADAMWAAPLSCCPVMAASSCSASSARRRFASSGSRWTMRSSASRAAGSPSAAMPKAIRSRRS